MKYFYVDKRISRGESWGGGGAFLQLFGVRLVFRRSVRLLRDGDSASLRSRNGARFRTKGGENKGGEKRSAVARNCFSPPLFSTFIPSAAYHHSADIRRRNLLMHCDKLRLSETLPQSRRIEPPHCATSSLVWGYLHCVRIASSRLLKEAVYSIWATCSLIPCHTSKGGNWMAERRSSTRCGSYNGTSGTKSFCP